MAKKGAATNSWHAFRKYAKEHRYIKPAFS